MFKLNDYAYIQMYTAIFLVLSAFSGGYSAADIVHAPISESVTEQYIEEAKNFDEFSNKAIEVHTLMSNTLADPTEYRLRSTNNQLAVIEWRWLSSQDGENKELFSEYLNECQSVVNDLQEKGEAHTSKMDELYDALV